MISALPKDVQLLLTTSSPIECRSNLALELLWDALDDDCDVKAVGICYGNHHYQFIKSD